MIGRPRRGGRPLGRPRRGRRPLGRAIAGAAALLGAAAVAAGCEPLDEIVPGRCGNGVVEPSRNEDCDCFDETASCQVETVDALGAKVMATCYPQGSESACRYGCDDDGEGCPGGWGCGIDRVCRAPKGTFTQLGAAQPLGAERLLAGDLDGDGRGDLVAVGPTHLEAVYHDANGTVGARVSIPFAGGLPALGRLTPALGRLGLTEDATADLALGAGSGVAILSGQPDRTFAPVPALAPVLRLDGFGEVDVNNLAFGGARLVPVGSTREQGQAWVALIAGTDAEGGAASEDVLAVGLATEASTSLSPLDLRRGRRELAGPPAVADLGGGPLHEVAVALAGDSAVHVYSPDDGAHAAVELPGAARVAGAAFLRDVTGDGVLDLLVGATCAQPDPGLPEGAACYELDVAEGAGGLEFGGLSPYGDLSRRDGGAGAARSFGLGPPIAIGDLNGDGQIDVVEPDAVRLGEPGLSPPYHVAFQRIAPSSGRRWTRAAIADATFDGVPDVIAADAAATGLSFFHGAAGALPSDFRLNELVIPTRGNVSSFAMGDVDGDLLPDVVFVEGAGSTPSGASRPALSVSFGRYRKAPEPPARVGALEGLLDLAAVRLPRPDDAVDDVGLLFSRGEGVAIGLLEGHGSRSLLPALPLVGAGAARQAGERRALSSIAGRFEGDRAQVASLTVAAPSPASPRGSAELWLLPALDAGAGALLSEGEQPVVLPPELTPSRELEWALEGIAVDLEGDGRDELVLSLPVEVVGDDPAAPAMRGAIVVARHDGRGAFVVTRVRSAGAQNTVYAGLRAGDVDGDQRVDVVGIAYRLEEGTRRITASRLAVFWNQGDGTLSGPVELDPSGGEPDDPESAVTSADFARIHAGAGAGAALVLLTRGAAYTLGACAGGAAICWTGADGRRFAVGKLDGIPGGSAIATCDALGDGVDDLAVLTDGALRVFEGAPIRR
ncbi:hypothetical protein [Sorangium sp. So ce131]|uniref:hypothetical protein n=1 Tax=Sorangium sp. So ce131 TaxID=3133282 RepID=UPI003F642D90